MINKILGYIYWKLNPLADPTFKNDFFIANQVQFKNHTSGLIKSFLMLASVFCFITMSMFYAPEKLLIPLWQVIAISLVLVFLITAFMLLGWRNLFTKFPTQNPSHYEITFVAICFCFYFFGAMFLPLQICKQLYNRADMTGLRPEYLAQFTTWANEYNLSLLKYYPVILAAFSIICYLVLSKATWGIISFIALKPKPRELSEKFVNYLVNKTQVAHKNKYNKQQILKPSTKDFRVAGHKSKEEKDLEDLL